MVIGNTVAKITARHKGCGFEVIVIGHKGRAVWWCYKCQKELKLSDIYNGYRR